ncbi:hypothetical protein D3OALGB2SA_5247 [Olavius algarvensis associated proteobacterium Delta 3]|nr:hypothetical protein D3OALGB2SA_5247 [Olavius algarvensis associated proteobacterium Delta 3]
MTACLDSDSDSDPDTEHVQIRIPSKRNSDNRYKTLTP